MLIWVHPHAIDSNSLGDFFSYRKEKVSVQRKKDSPFFGQVLDYLKFIDKILS